MVIVYLFTGNLALTVGVGFFEIIAKLILYYAKDSGENHGIHTVVESLDIQKSKQASERDTWTF